jgi:hypothetical protein
MKQIYIFCCALLAAAALQGQVIHVPGDYATIQQGINAANPGDTVLVADGIYYEQINFLGKKPLTVASQFIMDGDTSHIGHTVIDGSQIANPDSATVVYFSSGEDTTSVLCGFTIRNGRGTYFTAPGITVRADGGIHIEFSGAKILNNHITGNHLDDTTGTHAQIITGAGMGTSGAQQDSHWVVVDHNVIDHNTCYTSDLQASAAGVGIWCNARIANNTISWNTLTSTGTASSLGAALNFANDPAWTNRATVIVEHNVISNNISQAAESWANSAGVLFQAVTGIFVDNLVADNEVITWQYSGGVGGCYVYLPGEGTLFRNNTFSGNKSDMWGGALGFETDNGDPDPKLILVENNLFLGNEARSGGAIVNWNIPCILQNNVFSGNHATGTGGALFFSNQGNSSGRHMVTLINNSFSGNLAGLNGGAVYSYLTFPLIFNSIFWNDVSATGQGDEIYLYGSDTAEIAYSNISSARIHGPWENGGGILDQDPMFTDTVMLTIPDAGPGFNTATLSYTCNCGIPHACPLYDMEGMTRPLYGAPDMGAYEALHVGFRDAGTARQAWHSGFPNPFESQTAITFTLPEPCQVHIRIFDSYGQQVAEPLNSVRPEGEQKVTWKAGDLPAGIYLYRIEAGGKVGTGKMIKL